MTYTYLPYRNPETGKLEAIQRQSNYFWITPEHESWEAALAVCIAEGLDVSNDNNIRKVNLAKEAKEKCLNFINETFSSSEGMVRLARLAQQFPNNLDLQNKINAAEAWCDTVWAYYRLYKDSLNTQQEFEIDLSSIIAPPYSFFEILDSAQ